MYTVHIAEKLEKKLKQLPKRDQQAVIEKINQLADNPRPDSCLKLQGSHRPVLYRIRAGVYRIIYTIQEERLIVLIVELGHRKEVYRKS